jgi:hypothetical protein
MYESYQIMNKSCEYTMQNSIVSDAKPCKFYVCVQWSSKVQWRMMYCQVLMLTMTIDLPFSYI